ncbi:MAG: succinate dehydrogenase iron-sulfur subunit [Chloroflexi bacterium]|nr:succinate dehydrogenase iron-sulfur subunit [Chloroflexota bacterium]
MGRTPPEVGMDNIVLTVKRSGAGARPTPRWQAFSVPLFDERMSVLDALLWVQCNTDPTLAFRCACRVGMCGSCGVVINGRERLACRTLVRALAGDDGGEVRVEPMRHLPVVRDLVTDMASFSAKQRKVVPYLVPREGYQDLTTIPPTSRERTAIDPQRECIACGLCYSACTVAGMDGGFLGPAALNRAYVLVADSRDGAHTQRLRVIASEEGLWRCHSLFQCTAVCPKGISPTLAIQRLKRRVIAHNLKRLIGLAPRE